MTSHRFTLARAFACGLLAAACLETPDGPDDPKKDPPVAPAKELSVKLPFDPADTNATFTAHLEIVAQQRPIEGATVELGGRSFRSDANGRVTIEAVPLRDTPLARVSLGGFMPRNLSLAYATSGSQPLRVFLFPEGIRQKVAAATGGTVEHGAGKVVLPPNAIVDADGNAYTGDVAVSMRSTEVAELVKVGIDGKVALKDDVDADMVPPGFTMAEDADGLLKPTVPLASVQVELTDDTGNPLQLKAGASASLTLALPNGDLYPVGSEQETLVFDEERQLWKPAGKCTVQVVGDTKTCAGTASHFSTYAVGADWSGGDLWCARVVPVVIPSADRPGARLVRVIPSVLLNKVKLELSDRSNDGRIFVSPQPTIALDFRLVLQNAAGEDEGGEFSFRVDGAMLARTFSNAPVKGFRKEDLASLKAVPTAAFKRCANLVVPVLLAGAGAVPVPCDGKCDAATQLCVESSGTCVAKDASCDPACGANARCVAGSACVCDEGYFVDADGTCVACSTCGAGQYAAVACNPGRDTVCSACTAIEGCTNVLCTTESDSTCSECKVGEYKAGADCLTCPSIDGCAQASTCSAATNAQCSGCAAGRYLTNGTADRCDPCATIAGCAIETGCTTADNAQCELCGEGTYLVEGATDECRACSPVEHCRQGQASCTSSTDSICTECDEGYTLFGGVPGSCVPVTGGLCSANEHVVSGACTPCPAGSTRPAGDDPTGPDTSCTTSPGATVFDLSTAAAATDAQSFAGAEVVRGFEFAVDRTVRLSSVTVSGLPATAGSTAKLWRKTGAVELQVTDTFALGTPYTPSSSTSDTATFTFATPLSFAAGTYSLVVAVNDPETGAMWNLRQFPNSGQFLTSGSLTLGPLWGWWGNLGPTSNTASGVQAYDTQYFQVPKMALTFAP